MNATAPIRCYTCREPIKPGGKRYVATFNDKRWEVCPDCAEGIDFGLRVLAASGCRGERQQRNKL
jgi:hypothetical protein